MSEIERIEDEVLPIVSLEDEVSFIVNCGVFLISIAAKNSKLTNGLLVAKHRRQVMTSVSKILLIKRQVKRFVNIK